MRSWPASASKTSWRVAACALPLKKRSWSCFTEPGTADADTPGGPVAEASQSLKNARTVISLTPQELANGSALFTLFRNLLQKDLDTKNNT